MRRELGLVLLLIVEVHISPVHTAPPPNPAALGLADSEKPFPQRKIGASAELEELSARDEPTSSEPPSVTSAPSDVATEASGTVETTATDAENTEVVTTDGTVNTETTEASSAEEGEGGVTTEVTIAGENATEMSFDRRVIGGSEFEEGKWPWLVSIQGKIPTKTFLGIPLVHAKLYCGASLLNERWLLTAAHCVVNDQIGDKASDPKYWHARLGDTDLSSSLADKFLGVIGGIFDVDDWKQYYIHGDKIIIHPQYNPRRMWENDIALIRLREAVPSGTDIPEIQSVTLPVQGSTSFPANGAECIMKGWGCTAGGGPVSGVASEVTLPKLDDHSCRLLYGIDTTNRICAGRNLGSMGICSGDSGGPLVCDQDGTWIQAGIASFTSADRPGDYPGAFTRVASYVDWINENIRDN